MSLKILEESDQIWLQLPNLSVRKGPETEEYPTIWKLKKKKSKELKSRKNEADHTKELSFIFSIMMILQFCFLLIFLFGNINWNMYAWNDIWIASN